MASTTPPSALTAPAGVTRPKGLHHVGYVTQDAAKTTDFYTRVLGMKFVGVVINDKVPSTGDDYPYCHLFFEMGDGSTVAFFESIGLPAPAQPTHPGYDVFNHLALEVESKENVDAWAKHLKEQGVDFIGPVDHHVIYSLYFHDPSGVRIELTTTTNWHLNPESAQEDLRRWEEAKAKSKALGGDVKPLMDLVNELKGSYKLND